MTTKNNRHLAAILFSDIAGYSVLMGAGEARPSQLVGYYKTIQQQVGEDAGCRRPLSGVNQGRKIPASLPAENLPNRVYEFSRSQ